jgi:SAM-dependent methyltransferase
MDQSSREPCAVRIDTCPACRADQLVPLDTPGRWIGPEVFAPFSHQLGLEKCQRCRLVMVNPRPNDALLASFYQGNTYECHDTNDTEAMVIKADFVLDRVAAHAPRAKRLLDFGCGGGFLLRRARERGLSVHGFDLGRRAVERSRAQGFEVTASLDQLPRNHFDAIVLHHVFEHLPEPAIALSELADLLSPGGRVFLEVPNADSLRARLSTPRRSRRWGFDERFRAYPIHLWYLSPASLKELIESADYRVVGMETYGVGLDELFYRPRRETGEGRRSRLRQANLLRPVKSGIKRALFSALLGENLLAVAQPRAQRRASSPDRRAPKEGPVHGFARNDGLGVREADEGGGSA